MIETGIKHDDHSPVYALDGKYATGEVTKGIMISEGKKIVKEWAILFHMNSSPIKLGQNKPKQTLNQIV